MSHGSKPYKSRLVGQLNRIILDVNPAILPQSETLIALYLCLCTPYNFKMTDRLVIRWTILLEQLRSFLMQWKMCLISTVFPDCHCHCSAEHCWQLTFYCFVSYLFSSWSLLHLFAEVWLSFCSLSQGFFLLFLCHTMKGQPHYSFFFLHFIHKKRNRESALCSNNKLY